MWLNVESIAPSLKGHSGSNVKINCIWLFFFLYFRLYRLYSICEVLEPEECKPVLTVESWL